MTCKGVIPLLNAAFAKFARPADIYTFRSVVPVIMMRTVVLFLHLVVSR